MPQQDLPRFQPLPPRRQSCYPFTWTSQASMNQAHSLGAIEGRRPGPRHTPETTHHSFQWSVPVGTAIRSLLLALTALVGFFPLTLWAQSLSDGIAAIVNSDVITLSELQHELEHETIRLRARYSGKALAQRLRQKEYETLNRLIERKLQIQEATAKGYEVTEEELEQAMGFLKQTDQTLDNGRTPSKDAIREELLLRKVLDFEVRRHIMVSKEEIREEYKKGDPQFMTPALYHLRQILLVWEPGGDKATLDARARDIYRQLQNGADFSELAGRYSDGPEGVRGGDLGDLHQNDLLPPLAETLATLKPGEITQPIHTTLGIHILALDGIQPPQPRPYEEVEEDIRNMLFQKKSKDIYQTWLAGLKEKAYIEINF